MDRFPCAAPLVLLIVGQLVYADDPPTQAEVIIKTPGAPPRTVIVPRLSGTVGKQTSAPDKPVYDTKADAKEQIQTALRNARKENRRVLIQWGGNWCSWCLLLHKRFRTDPTLARELLYEYDVVHVDIGHVDKNMDLAKHYGADLKNHGVPFLTILDADGKALVNQPTDPFETHKDAKGGKNGHDPKKLLTFLKTYEATPRVAQVVLSAGLAQAGQTGRLVFLHFGAPWCGWCHRLDDWLAKPEIVALMGKDFVDVKIDNERMKGGKEIFARYNPDSKTGGIPWFVMLDADGKARANSTAAKGNVGFPATPEEIAHFVKMLKTCRRNLTDDDIAVLRRSLVPPAKSTARAGHGS